LSAILKEKDMEIGDLRGKCSHLEINLQEFKHFEQRSKEYEQKIKMLMQELERLNQNSL
jgi:hypothetical protein